MAEEELELKKSLAKAKEEERIYEQMNNEEFQYSQCLVHPQITLRKMQTLPPCRQWGQL